MRIVRSSWVWDETGKVIRKTWDPQLGNWAPDGKAGGADNVFKSRLPRPMRIKSLDDAITTEEVLLTLALSPLVKELKTLESDNNSQISKDKAALAATVNALAVLIRKDFPAFLSKYNLDFKVSFQGLEYNFM